MRWFGHPWPDAVYRAPICDSDAYRVSAPVGKPCIYCPATIGPNDRGVLMAATMEMDEAFTMEIREQVALDVARQHEDALTVAEWVDGPGVVVEEIRRTVCAAHIDCLVRATLGEEIAKRVAPPRTSSRISNVVEDLADDPVLGRCPHGVDLDREFCPHGCRV